jgi:hypothetical protein
MNALANRALVSAELRQSLIVCRDTRSAVHARLREYQDLIAACYAEQQKLTCATGAVPNGQQASRVHARGSAPQREHRATCEGTAAEAETGPGSVRAKAQLS